MDELVRTIEDGFYDKYANFKEFQTDETYRPLWDLCIDTVKDHNSINIIIFCNDTYKIPPVKVFIDLNRDKLETILKEHSGDFLTDEKRLKTYVKQCLGAFWGMVFRFGLHYADRCSMTVAQKDYYGIATASRFIRKGRKE